MLDPTSTARVSRSLSELALSGTSIHDGGVVPPVQLPLDFARTVGGEPRVASFAFTLDVPDALLARFAQAEAAAPRRDSVVVAALGAQVARWAGLAVIALEIRRWAPSAMRRSRRVAALPVGEVSLRELVAQAGHALDRAGDADPPAEGDRVAITWLDGSNVGSLGTAGGPESLVHATMLPPNDVVLHLVVAAAGDAPRAALVYDANLLHARTVERFAARLQAFLADASVDVDAPIAARGPIAEEELAWIASSCEGGPRRREIDCAHRVIEGHARATPDAVAARWRDRTLTFEALNARANQLARHLIALGVSAEQRVVVSLEPSVDIAIVVLAIWKAGGVYVPVDPSLPVARVRAIVEDTAPVAVVSRTDLAERLELGAPLVALDAAGTSLDALPMDNLEVLVALEQTASIYYTSGTTGRPKGVMASHANVASYVGVAIDRYGFVPADVMPALARFGFSISMLELMMPLVGGGTLMVLDREQVLDPASLARVLTGVTFFHAGPSLLKTLIAHVRRSGTDVKAFARVRHASSGGDMVPPEVLEGLKQVFTEAEVFVIYGCSEISCMGCTWPVPRDRVVVRTLVGRPFDGVAVRVLDADLRQVPAGVVGEIHFTGVGITKGYLDRPELTAEKFVEIDGRRFYRTGDVGRLDAEGWVEMLGRRDFQVKIRGMRIELPEVEHHLRRAPGVRDGVVSARDAADGEKALCAYMVPDPDDRGDGGRARRIAEVRRFMSEQLPDYMVPSIYVELPALPLNHNMKVDRLALPPPEACAGVRSTRRREPETAFEQQLAALWCRLLGTDAVGLDDNFFELGGHSILAVELLQEVERALGVELEGMTVLRETLELQAAICERHGQAASAPVSRRRARSRPVLEPRELFHFGKDHELYGVLDRPLDGAKEGAVLLCPPMGQEHVRADFVLQRLAATLSARGVPVMRFDWFGCRDSMGESFEATCSRWGRDVEDACAELARRTRAARVTAIGARLGATILWNAAPRLDLERVVLWDPVTSGADHHREMVGLQHRWLRTNTHLRPFRWPSRRRDRVELAGATWSTAALRELDLLSIDLPSRPVPTSALVTAGQEDDVARLAAALAGDPASCVERVELDCRWNDVAQVEDILPDVGISERLATLALGER